MATSKITDPFQVTAVIVAHDGAIWLPEVVAALSSQTRKIDHIVAVDNGSVDKSAALLKAAKIPVLSMPRDAGFGDAVYRAVEKLPKSNNERNEWIWVIHDDCAPKSDALEKLSLYISTDGALASMRMHDKEALTEMLSHAEHPLYVDLAKCLFGATKSAAGTGIAMRWLMGQALQPLTPAQSREQAELLVDRTLF